MAGATTASAVLSAEAMGILPAFDERTSANELLDAMTVCDRWESQLVWARYVRAEQMFDGVSDADYDADVRLLDDFALTSARLASARSLSRHAADTMLREAVALVYRIPLIGECLRDGVISPRQFQRLVVHTDLIDGMPYCAEVDADIAAELRRRGVWSAPRLRDLADRMICRYDPYAVRHRRDAAKNKRTCWSRSLPYGMAQLGVIASAEDVALALAAVNEFAGRVCTGDPRSVAARRSDAAICQLQRVPFECLCGREDCDATVVDEGGVSARQARIDVHVICQDRTLASGCNADGAAAAAAAAADDTRTSSDADMDSDTHVDRDRDRDRAGLEFDPVCDPDPDAEDRERPGFLDGHGVISAAHVREIAARPDAVIRVLNPVPGALLSSRLPSDPYRFSAALDTFIRARDGYCVFPGCTAPAWAADIDHVTEFNHEDPEQGGSTSAANANIKCRFHHLVKTFGDWLDDQTIDPDGNLRTVFATPEGFRRCGVGQTNEAMFPALRQVRFADSPTSAHASQDPSKVPKRRRPRTVDKHARRRSEREKNRRVFGGPAPF